MKKMITMAAVMLAPICARGEDVTGDRYTTARMAASWQGQPSAGRETFEGPGDSDWFKVRLRGGTDYAVACDHFLSDGGETARLRSPSGKILAETECDDSEGADAGFQFRARSSGTYFVEAQQHARDGLGPGTFPDRYGLAIGPDCRGDRSTECSLRPGSSRDARTAYGSPQFDDDWFRADLSKGRAYTITMSCGVGGGVDLLAADGRTIVAHSYSEPGPNGPAPDAVISGFRPARAGAYYLSAVCLDDNGRGATYHVSMR